MRECECGRLLLRRKSVAVQSHEWLQILGTRANVPQVSACREHLQLEKQYDDHTFPTRHSALGLHGGQASCEAAHRDGGVHRVGPLQALALQCHHCNDLRVGHALPRMPAVGHLPEQHAEAAGTQSQLQRV